MEKLYQNFGFVSRLIILLDFTMEALAKLVGAALKIKACSIQVHY